MRETGTAATGWGEPRPVQVLLDVAVTPPRGSRERQSFRYPGMWWRRGAEGLCRYDEQGHATVTTVKFSKSAVTLLRQGEIACRQAFRVGEAGRSLYRTAYGTFSMAWRCRHLQVDMAPPECGLLAQLAFSYDLELGGTFLGNYAVSMRIQARDP